ncbi:MAG: hypothetical protein COX62_07000 [Deltaproteobacteria bacterium CG_4_10_14_0_2_um_filter_43_8]|nr:MAG: hypothetical protein COV43_02885 [Deltaproteobacteria bacterium CG11_big_fil_rev_8_21_14_0_20_42_23]PJA19279.1 MAG: hypothetical protein COX62_07000 [Deltaproteobacteria bacterium CG_4_10_14_0_2_um_filter_43_8]PJC63730.1 MAG: hypothetical protein CO021_07500 [Deltaproteobacteria bacterium CG_4_9_14_0_2_um_filter_42_21]
MNQVKSFKYDVLIGPEDLCNREEERKSFLSAAKKGKRVVLFAPRRYGKTSLIRNIVGLDFQKGSRKHFLLNFDLMDVRSMESIEERLHTGLTHALSSHFSPKKILAEIIGYLKGFTVQIDQNPNTGQPSVQLTSKKKEAKKNIYDYFDSIKQLSKKYKLMIVLDEFHDIAFVEGAEALFRIFLQELQDTAIFILGSKRHLLKVMFQDSNAPLFHYGDEAHLYPISVEHWLPYFQERLHPAKLKIEEAALSYLVKKMYDVPNAICEVGEWLRENVPQKTIITKTVVEQQLSDLIQRKQSFAYLLQAYSEKEKTVLKMISFFEFVKEPSSDNFLKTVRLPKSTTSHIIKKLLDVGAIEFEIEKGYRVSDPLLGYYLLDA